MADKRNSVRLEGQDVSILIAAKSPLVESNQEPIVLALLPVLEELAKESGRYIQLHVCEPETVHYPEEDDKVIHVVLGGTPPGVNSIMWADRIGDTRLHPNPNKSIRVTGVASGYGEVVTDASERRVAQIVGSTIYLCLPIDEDYLYLLAGNGTNLFQVTVQMAWKAIVSRKATQLVGALDEQGFITYAQHERDNFLTKMEEELKDVDEELTELNKKVCRLLLQRRLLQARITSYPEVICTPQEEIVSDWKHLSNHPLVDYLERSMDDKLHVHTKDVLVSDEQGFVRHLGRFIIRIEKFTTVTVWSKYLTHPERRAHPHISKFGLVCFGNVTAEINRLLGNGSEAQVVILVLAWLAEGYDADLADTKLEEWPLASEVDPVLVLNLRTVFCTFSRDTEVTQEEE